MWIVGKKDKQRKGVGEAIAAAARASKLQGSWPGLVDHLRAEVGNVCEDGRGQSGWGVEATVGCGDGGGDGDWRAGLG